MTGYMWLYFWPMMSVALIALFHTFVTGRKFGHGVAFWMVLGFMVFAELIAAIHFAEACYK